MKLPPWDVPLWEIGKIQLAIYGACTAHASQVAYRDGLITR